MSRTKTILWSASFGAALGAGFMYLLDPDRGHRRRTQAIERGGSAMRQAGRAAAKLARDVENRTRGMAAHTYRGDQAVDDDILESRVRTRLGRLVEHPHQVDVRARDGEVTLSGIVGRDECDRVITGVRAVAGVKSVDNRLSEAVPVP